MRFPQSNEHGQVTWPGHMCREMSKGTSQCFQPPSKSQSRRLPVESAMPGTTLQTIQLKAFTSGGSLFGEVLFNVGDVPHDTHTHARTHARTHAHTATHTHTLSLSLPCYKKSLNLDCNDVLDTKTSTS